MLHFVMTACFKYVVETYYIALNICIGVYDAISNSSLCCQVYHNLWLVFSKYIVDELLVGNIAFDNGIKRQDWQDKWLVDDSLFRDL